MARSCPGTRLFQMCYKALHRPWEAGGTSGEATLAGAELPHWSEETWKGLPVRSPLSGGEAFQGGRGGKNGWGKTGRRMMIQA